MRARAVPLAVVLLLASACGHAPSDPATSSTPMTSATSAASSASASVTPSATTATSTAMTSSAAAAPVGTVVTLPDNGVQFMTAAQINAATYLSGDERAFLVKQLATFQKGGNTCATLVLSGYRVADLMNGEEFESATAPCTGGGGYAILWGKVSGTWKQLVAGQDVPDCPAIRTVGWKSTIPNGFFGGQCYEKGSTTAVEYKP